MFRWQGESRSIVPPVLEASTLTHAQRRGLFARRSPLLRFQDDENLVALTRKGHQHAFDSLVERYQSRLLGFCRQMLGSTEDAEDVLQEVFVAAYNAMVADERPIAVRPWLYRIARNRCLNHLRKPTADGQDTMDTHPHMNGVTTLERVQNREEFRNLLSDVGQLPETQRSALLLREIDAMSYEEIAQAMDTTVPGVKSLLVRARIALAESSQARQLTCDEVRIELAEAAEGIAKVTGRLAATSRRAIPAASSAPSFAPTPRRSPRSSRRARCSSSRARCWPSSAASSAAVAAEPLPARAAGVAPRPARAQEPEPVPPEPGGRRWCRSGRCRGRSRCGSCRSGRCGGREHGRDRRCRGSRRCGRRWRSRSCGRCCGRDRDQGGRRARHGGDPRRRGRGDPERHRTIIPASRPQQSKTRQIHKTPPATAAKAEPAQEATPPATPATTPPVAATAPPPVTVTVPPQTTDPTASTGSQTGGTTASATGEAQAARARGGATATPSPLAPAQTGPVTTGVEPSTCDADGDGVADPGAPRAVASRAAAR